MGKHTPTPWTNEPNTMCICSVGHNLDDPGVWSEAIPESGPYPFGTKTADAARIVACINAFHSPEGREIATEQITEGLFWEMRDLLGAVKEMLNTFYDPHVFYKHESWDGDQRPLPLSKASSDVAALLSKLEPQG